jgi:hypothetical protein
MSEKLYILIRADLPLGDQIAQACHTTAEWCKRWQEGNKDWNNETIVVVSVLDLSHLVHCQMMLELKCIEYSIFCEPDLQGQRTGIACYTDSNVFDKLPLWGPVIQG